MTPLAEKKLVELPIPEKALADCGAILGRRGAGKSGTGRVLLEHELDAGHRCCVIDPKGDWYGIRAKKDGSPSRFEVPVFGGAHADVPIDDSAGARLGQIVATSSTSCVVDLSGFSVAGMRRFMTAFAEALFFSNRAPLTLFVDEADQLAPQRVAADQARLLHNMEMLIRQGRQRGIFMWMLTQRPAVINKNLLSQAETLIAMKMTGPQDRKAIRDWMDAHDPDKASEVEGQLAGLSVGQAFAWVPGADFLERVQFPLFETFDSGRTPQHGEAMAEVELSRLDVGAIAAALAPADADQEESELDQLRAINARLVRRNEELLDQQRQGKDAEARLLALLTEVQDVIGARIGSQQIVPLPAGADPADYVMLVDAEDVVRPYPRERFAQPERRVTDARRRIADAPMPPAPEPEQVEATASPAAIAALMDGKLLGEIASDVPAVRRIVAAVAINGPLERDRIAELAGVSRTSSHMGVGLRRLVERGILHQDGSAFALARAHG